MKKLLIISLIFFTSILGGCDRNFNRIKNNLSEVRYNIFAGENDNFKITFMSGKREKDYSINGYNTDLIDFGVITINPKNSSIDLSNSNIIVNIENKEYSEILEKNPFDSTFVADIGVLIDNGINTISIKIPYNDSCDDIMLNNVSADWEVNHSKALKLAYTRLSKELKPHITTEFLGEIYVKIIEDTLSNNDKYLWYVNFASRVGRQYSVIIDTMTGEILAEK